MNVSSKRSRARRAVAAGLGAVVAAGLTFGAVALAPNASAEPTAAYPAPAGQTVGDGTVENPAEGPAPSQQYADDVSNFKLVKNWDFGANGTVKSYEDMNREFMYKDQWGTINNGGNYGSNMVAPKSEIAYEGAPTTEQFGEVREFEGDSLKTNLIPIEGNDGKMSDTADPTNNNVGNGSFTAKWNLPKAGKLLGQDVLWETRVRYDEIPENWFAIWNAGTSWDKGAEFDVVESFGFDGNADGNQWHADPVGAEEAKYNYLGANGGANWGDTMKLTGVPLPYSAQEFHTFAVLYRADDTFTFFLDGHETNSGVMHWTTGGVDDASKATDFFFLFDAGFGHNGIDSVRGKVPMADLKDKHYEFDYSRVYMTPKK
jgi:hypothetical protein